MTQRYPDDPFLSRPMPRPSQAAIEQQLDALERVVATHPQGLARSELGAAFESKTGEAIHWRTLLRRLGELIAQGRVRTEGEGIRTLYLPGPALVVAPPAAEEGYVPLSVSGARVRGLVRRPIIDRPPVGYDASLLHDYQPGRTWYLARPLRERLHEQGRAMEENRPAGTYAREIFGRLLIDLSWASSRLEGNTYTRLDTQNLLEFGQQAEGRDASEAQMILNHKAAIELLVANAEAIGFNAYTIQNLHAALSENLLGDPADEGRLRTRLVHITGTPYQPPGVPQQIEERFRTLLAKAEAIPDPFEQAFFAMVHLPYLQPFADVNKRTARLAANISLIKANLVPLSFVDVPERAYIEGTLGVYELGRVDLLRDVFAWAYERSCAQYRVVQEAMGGPDPLRIRYRTVLHEAVRSIVQRGDPPARAILRDWARLRVEAGDEEAVAERALALLLGLHEGGAARYGLLPSEVAAWRARHGRGPQLGLF